MTRMTRSRPILIMSRHTTRASFDTLQTAKAWMSLQVNVGCVANRNSKKKDTLEAALPERFFSRREAMRPDRAAAARTAGWLGYAHGGGSGAQAAVPVRGRVRRPAPRRPHLGGAPATPRRALPGRTPRWLTTDDGLAARRGEENAAKKAGGGSARRSTQLSTMHDSGEEARVEARARKRRRRARSRSKAPGVENFAWLPVGCRI